MFLFASDYFSACSLCRVDGYIVRVGTAYIVCNGNDFAESSIAIIQLKENATKIRSYNRVSDLMYKGNGNEVDRASMAMAEEITTENT